MTGARVSEYVRGRDARYLGQCAHEWVPVPDGDGGVGETCAAPGCGAHCKREAGGKIWLFESPAYARPERSRPNKKSGGER